ncbi:cytochrome c-type biogenesis protein CcmH [Alphaproteobacteria bacterium]|nr:cytochrome c-type biogenesis protein CcmH [Alphaproteobacteria bacterium]
MTRRVILMILALFLPLTAHSLAPGEALSDPILESRARALSLEIRCLVCQNQSIDDSDADLAKDLRLLVRERLVKGDSDADIKKMLTDRYGEFVLFRPTFSGHNVALWLAPFIALLLGLFAFLYIIRQSKNNGPTG